MFSDRPSTLPVVDRVLRHRGVERDFNRAAQAVLVVVQLGMAFQLGRDAVDDEARAETVPRGGRDRRAAALLPFDPQHRIRLRAMQAPLHLDPAGRRQERAVLRGIGRQLVKRQRQGERRARQERHRLALDDDRIALGGNVGRGRRQDEIAQIRALPMTARELIVGCLLYTSDAADE